MVSSIHEGAGLLLKSPCWLIHCRRHFLTSHRPITSLQAEPCGCRWKALTDSSPFTWLCWKSLFLLSPDYAIKLGNSLQCPSTYHRPGTHQALCKCFLDKYTSEQINGVVIITITLIRISNITGIIKSVVVISFTGLVLWPSPGSISFRPFFFSQGFVSTVPDGIYGSKVDRTVDTWTNLDSASFRLPIHHPSLWTYYHILYCKIFS